MRFSGLVRQSLLLATIAGNAATVGQVTAQVDVPCARTIPYDTTALTFVRVMVSALDHASSTLDEFDDTSPLEVILFFRRTIGEYQCASALLSPFLEHPNEDVRDAVEAGQLLFTVEQLVNEALLGLYRSRIDGDASLTESAVADSMASLVLKSDAVTKQLPLVMVASVAASLIEVNPASNRATRLAMTALQRDSILHDLVDIFGSDVTKPSPPEQSWLMGAAWALYRSLADSQWQLKPFQ